MRLLRFCRAGTWSLLASLLSCSQSVSTSSNSNTGTGTGGTPSYHPADGGSAGQSSRADAATASLIPCLVDPIDASPASDPADAQSTSAPEISEASSALTRNTSPSVGDSDFQAVIGAANQFGFDLFHQILPGETGNMVFSPVSTVYALGMTYLGARGNTQTQMATVLHDTFGSGVYHSGLNRLSLALANRNVTPHQTQYGCMSATLTLENAIWCQLGFTLSTSYLDDLSANYGAGVKLLDFVRNAEVSRNTINLWVAHQTAHLILDLLPPDSIQPGTRLVLTDTLYFKGWWNTPFSPTNTTPEVFTRIDGSRVNVSTMHEYRDVLYGWGTNYTMIDLPYDGNQLSMAFVLPDSGQFNAVRDGLTQDWRTQALSQMLKTGVNLVIPKFGFTWGTADLTPALQALGIRDAFDYPSADFTGIEATRDLSLSGVFHKAFVGVDESTTVATAATAEVSVTVALAGAGRGGLFFVLDRPFLFFIHDATGAVLFIGQVLDPNAS